MSEQLPLYRANERISNQWAALLPMVRSVVDFIGLKECAWRCDTSPSMLADALAERNHRYLRVEWLLAILDAAPVAVRETAMKPLAATVGFDISRRRELTPEEELAALRRIVARVAPIALEQADKEMGK